MISTSNAKSLTLSSQQRLAYSKIKTQPEYSFKELVKVESWLMHASLVTKEQNQLEES